jgi:hypothetical protein
LPNYNYLNSDLTDLIKGQPGTDLTSEINQVLNGLSDSDKAAQLTCLNNAYYRGRVDFRDDAKCLFPDYLLLAFAVIISTVLAKCECLVESRDAADIPNSHRRTPAGIQAIAGTSGQIRRLPSSVLF